MNFKIYKWGLTEVAEVEAEQLGEEKAVQQVCPTATEEVDGKVNVEQLPPQHHWNTVSMAIKRHQNLR